MFLHDAQELDNDLGAGSDQDLTLAGLFGVVDGVERIVEDARLDHVGDGTEILNSWYELRYLLCANESETLAREL